GRHQHRPQPGLLRSQPRRGRGRPEDRGVASGGGDRDPPRSGRGRAAARDGRTARRSEEAGPRCLADLPAQRAPRPLRQGPPGHSGGAALMEALIVAFFVFIGCFIAGACFKFWLRLFGVYDTLEEGRAKVYVLFGSVIGALKEPGLYFLWKELGPRALLVRWLGKVHTVDMRLTQEYLRSQPVNSEEGAPM